MTNPVSVITPVANYHIDLLPRATASVEAQTVKCNHIVIHDEAMRGSGWARNRGLEAVTTDFVIFLDADDWIESNFVERCLQAYMGGRYVFTDWFEDENVKRAPECPWTNGNFHVITTLLPTAWAKAVGGFDEGLVFAEDTYLYVSLCAQGMCGRRLPEPLFHYGREGQRARQYVNTSVHRDILGRLAVQFGGKTMACCGNNEPVSNSPEGTPQEGDVLVTALWGGNRTVLGRMTGRAYPRTSYPKTLWADPRDVDAMPSMFRRADEAPPMIIPAPPPVQLQQREVRELNGAEEVAAFMAGGLPPKANSVVAVQTVEAVNVPMEARILSEGQTEPRPNTRKLVNKGRRARGKRD